MEEKMEFVHSYIKTHKTFLSDSFLAKAKQDTGNSYVSRYP